MARQGALTLSCPNFVHCPVSQSRWPRHHALKERALTEGGPWSCKILLRDLSTDVPSTQEPVVIRRGYGMKSLVWALERLVTIKGEFGRKLEVTKHQHWRRWGPDPVLTDMQPWLSQALYSQTWTRAGSAVACGKLH